MAGTARLFLHPTMVEKGRQFTVAGPIYIYGNIRLVDGGYCSKVSLSEGTWLIVGDDSPCWIVSRLVSE